MTKLENILAALGCGHMKMTPYVVMADGVKAVNTYSISINDEAKRVTISSDDKTLFDDRLYLEYTDSSITCRRSFENTSGDVLAVKELGIELKGIDFGKDAKDDYFYHNENPRVYMQLNFTVDHHPGKGDAQSSDFDPMAGNKWHDEGVVHERIGASPYQPFPAILVSNYNTSLGLVHGSLSQRVCYHNYTIEHTDGVELNIYSSFKAIDHMDMSDGKIIIDEWYLGTTDKADDYEKIFENYTDVLRKKLPANYGSTNINRDNMVWGSWNDGVFRDVSEELLLTEAKYLKENFPTVRWIQLDDGYAVYDECAHGLGMPYEGEDGINHNKFPNGLRHTTDKIREIGLRPAIWIGGFCPVETPICIEHPEWMFDYSYRVNIWKVLDVSVPETRDYMSYAANVLCKKYGFEAVKHDFWSYAFEDSHSLLKNKDKSGYEHRDWWCKEIRSNIASDGYFQTGCDIVMGNPFLGEHFTNYRYGIDIGSGNWDNVKTNFLWGAACFALHTGDIFVPNSDSVGMLPGLNDDEAYFTINYCLVTHSMVEIAGLLSKAEHNGRYRMLKKAACNPNNGQDIYFVNYDYRQKKCGVPEIIYFDTPHFSTVENSAVMPVKTVGIFNVAEEEKTYSFTAKDLGLGDGNYILTDVWSGEQFKLDDNTSFTVRPHASMLLAVSNDNSIQLYDANTRINSAELNGNKLILETDYADKDIEMFLSQKAVSAKLNGVAIDFTLKDNTIFFDALEKGTVEISF